MKRVFVALLAALVVLSGSAATAKKKKIKPAGDQEVLVPLKTEDRRPVPQDKARKTMGADDDPDASRTPGPVAVGPAVETRMSKASSNKLDLRSLPFLAPDKVERPEREAPPSNPTAAGAHIIGGPPSPFLPQPPQRSAPAPAPLATFDGLDFATWGAGHPPDTNGDVGPTYYIQTINTSIGVFRKSDGVRVAAFTFNTFMSQGNFGNLCDTNNFGDPVVLYDSFEDRWIITDFAFQLSSGNVVNPPGNFQCFAVSMNGDPVTGGWNFYSINTTGGLGDYPKLGIWPDGLYMSVNMFGYPSGAAFQNTRLYALNKAQMYAGSPTVKVVSFDLPADQFTVIPANARLQTGTPPTGSPNYFASVWNFLDSVQIWKFHVDWDHLPLSTVTGASNATAASWWEQYNRSGTTTAPSPANFLDTLYPRLMVQNQYSKFGAAESLWLSHTVGAGNPGPANVTSAQAAVRYYQVDVTGGTVAASTPQAFTYSPDATAFRYMPSVAVNRAGDLAMGYTTSNATTNPTLSYAGRLAGDAPNTITLTEQLLFAGTGSQSGTCGTTCTRWGDYSAMTLDPDGCKFWYTNEYYATTGLNHQTRIGSFVYPSCTPVGAGGSVQGTVTAAVGGAPISGATVNLGARTTTTNASGGYTFSGIPAGTYPTITASYVGYNPSTANSIVVTDGGTTTQDFSLTSASNGSCLVDTTQADFQGGVATNVEVTSSPGDVKLTNPNLVDQQSVTSIAGGFSLTSTTWNGQTFKAGISGTLVAVDVNLFCLSCTGTTPNFTASIRATTAGLPTGADLVSTTVAGFNDGGAGSTHTADFSATPLVLTAGTTYAFIIRPVANPSAGGYDFSVSFTPNPYAFGSRVSSTNSGGTWAATATRSAIFHTYVNNGFSPSGNLISSVKDGNPSVGNSPTWSTLSWNAVTPANTTVQFQAAGASSPNGPFNFVGPDGTAGTFFTTSGASIAQFNGSRYLEYKAILSSTNNTVTPTLNDVTVCFADVACGSPAPTITPTPASLCPLSAGNTASVPAGAKNYSWAATNGTITAGGSSPTVTYTAGPFGSVGLQLTETDATGCIVVSTASVPIAPGPPTITPGGPTTFCTGGSVTLSSSALTGNQWSLNGNPIGGETNQTYVATATGNYSVTTTSGACTSVPSTPTVVTVNPLPAAPTITPGGPTTFCAGGSVLLTSTSASGNQWLLNGNPIGGETNQTYSATGSGNYTVTVTDGNSCTSVPSAGITVTVNPLPSTPSITPGGPTTFTYPGSVTLNSSSATGYQWYLNGNPIGGQTNQSYVASASGSYTVTVSDGNGCISAPSAPASVVVNPATPVVTAVGGTFVYDGTPKAGSGTATGGAGESLTVTLSYSGTGSTVYGPSATAPSLAGTYTVVAHTPGDANNSAGDSTPTALNITKASPTVTATGGTFTYDGNPHAGSGAATGGGGESLSVTLAYNGTGSTTYGPSATAPSLAGTYTVTAHTPGDANNNAGDSSATALTINKFNTLMAAFGGTFTYNGAPRAGSGQAIGGAGETFPVTLSYQGISGTTYGPTAAPPTNVGVYLITAHTVGDANNNAEDSLPNALRINKATATIVVTGYCVAFDGSAHTAIGTATGVIGESLTGLVVSATTHTAAGTYAGDAWTFSGAPNYNDANGTVNDSIVNSAITTAPVTTAGTTGNVASVANAGAGATYVWGITNGTITGGAGTTSITFTAGAVGTLTLNLTVTTSVGCPGLANTNVTVLPLVTVTSLSPTGGTVTGGNTVTINGIGFASGAAVTFGGTAATNVVVVSAIKITAKTPAHTAGAVNVTVTNTDTSTGTLTNGFLYSPQVFDPNNDGTITSADIFYLVNYLFMNGPAPNGPGGVLSGDANGDGVVSSADIFYLVNYLFLGGQKPNMPSALPSMPRASAVGAEGPQLAGSITLGNAVLRAGRYFVPVIMTANPGSITPQSMAFRAHFETDGTFGDLAVHSAGAAKDAGAPLFEIGPRMGNDVSYLVSYDPRNGGLNLGASHSAVVAEIEIAANDANVVVSLDPTVTMLSDQAGTMTATVANGKLKVSGTTIRSDAPPQPRAPRSEVN